MPTKEPFEIDIGDLDSIRAKIPEVDEIIELKRDNVREAQREFAHWQQVRDRLHLLANPSGSVANDGKQSKPNAVSLVVGLLDEIAVPLRAAQVEARLGGKLSRKTVNWALWKANKDELIQKIDQGLYVSLNYGPGDKGSEQEKLLES